MNKELSKYQLGNLIVSVIMLLNYILICLIGSGLFEKNSQAFIENYFTLSITIIPLALVVALCVIQNNNQEELSYKKQYSTYLPFIQTIMLILLFGIKYSFQLDREILFQIIVISITFVLVQIVLIGILLDDEYLKKRFYITTFVSLVSFASYIGLMLILSYDYSVLL